MKENWKEIEGYNKKYAVSDLGNIKSFLFKTPRLLKPDKSRTYLCVSLSNNTKVKRVYIHLLVAKYFVENPNNLPQVNHKDENKLNNIKSNLEYVSHRDNISYSATKNSISKINGVHWIERMKSYQCSVFYKGKKHYLGSTKDINVAKERVLEFKKKNNLI